MSHGNLRTNDFQRDKRAKFQNKHSLNNNEEHTDVVLWFLIFKSFFFFISFYLYHGKVTKVSFLLIFICIRFLALASDYLAP